MKDQYKQQMKAYRKKKMKKDNTPYLPANGKVYVMNSLDPVRKIKAKVLKTFTKQHREIIEILACPICKSPMEWDDMWEAFICEEHGKKAIYEIVSKR
jgi:hypothetical protein